MIPYEFPEKAAYGKVLPKTKIYTYASVGSRVKALFTRQVERITWGYKLSSKTINLPASGYVQEVQVMLIDLKGGELNQDVLAAIDKAIPSPIIFVLRYKNKIRYAACYKRPSEADKSKRVISVYFESEWMKDGIEKRPLSVALNLKGLYHNLLRALIPLSSSNDESIDGLIARAERIQIMRREAEKLEVRMNVEKQYNRKVELHSQLGNIKKEIAALSRN
jgi:hypothetical protein